MKLEERLRRELDRAAPAAVPAAPPLSELHDAVSARRRRNRRVAGIAAAAVVAVGITGGLLTSRSEPSTDVIATAPDGAESGAVGADANDGGEATTSGEGAQADQGSGEDSADSPDAGSTTGADPDGRAAVIAETTRLQAAATPIAVDTQASAVEFAGGSGVFVVATDDGYSALASRFGGSRGVTMIGLESENGLDWTEVGLSGVPAGATATHLREFGGTFVALYSQFDAVAQRNVITVSTSSDLTTWTSVAALPGDDVVVSDLAVGPAGVVVVGEGRAPDVWAGPLAGPFERVGSIDTAVTIAGLVAIDDGFVAAGTSDGAPTLFESPDGGAWTPLAMSGLADDDAVVEVAVADGIIMIAGGGERAWTAASTDGGQTWTRSELDRSTVESVATSGRSMSFLGASPQGAPTVTITDGTTWSSAELDIDPGDRIELLASGDRTVLLAAGENGLTWVVATR